MAKAKTKNAFQQWLKQSKGDMPKEGVKGVYTDWFDIGTLAIKGKSIDAADLWILAPDDGVTLKAKPGQYVVQARGITFDKHLRVAAVRVFLEGNEPDRGDELGEVPVDSWGVCIGEIDAFFKDVDDDTIAEFADTLSGLYADGAEIVTWEIEDRSMSFAIAFTGLGSGGYPAFELKSGKTTVGLEVEFIQDGFVME